MKIKRQDKISNRQLLERANVERLSEEVRRKRWRFIGHILRQQPDNAARQCGLNIDPRGKEKVRPAKSNLAAHSRKREVQRRLAVLECGARCSTRQESMEST